MMQSLARTFAGFLALGAVAAAPRSAAAQIPSDSVLRGLAPLIGAWSPSGRPEVVVHEYSWTVGVNAIRIRENFPPGRAADAELVGLVYWNPALERIELIAVAGHGSGQGRMFSGEYRVLADGRIERVYDVFYRTLTDTPAEELGGASRRYREIYRWPAPDSLVATLDWWHQGSWRPFGPGTYTLVRRKQA